MARLKFRLTICRPAPNGWSRLTLAMSCPFPVPVNPRAIFEYFPGL